LNFLVEDMNLSFPSLGVNTISFSWFFGTSGDSYYALLLSVGSFCSSSVSESSAHFLVKMTSRSSLNM
jgi:hypothetical protein